MFYLRGKSRQAFKKYKYPMSYYRYHCKRSNILQWYQHNQFKYGGLLIVK